MMIVTRKGQHQCLLLLGYASMLRSIKCRPQLTVGYVVTGQGEKYKQKHSCCRAQKTSWHPSTESNNLSKILKTVGVKLCPSAMRFHRHRQICGCTDDAIPKVTAVH